MSLMCSQSNFQNMTWKLEVDKQYSNFQISNFHTPLGCGSWKLEVTAWKFSTEKGSSLHGKLHH